MLRHRGCRAEAGHCPAGFGACSGSGLERPAEEGESPVRETLLRTVASVPEYGGARETPSESGGTTLQGYILVRDR
jgi:hypothetical protein